MPCPSGRVLSFFKELSKGYYLAHEVEGTSGLREQGLYGWISPIQTPGLVLQAEQAWMCPGHDAFRHVMEGRAGLAVASITTGGGTGNCASLPAQAFWGIPSTGLGLRIFQESYGDQEDRAWIGSGARVTSMCGDTSLISSAHLQARSDSMSQDLPSAETGLVSASSLPPWGRCVWSCSRNFSPAKGWL